jgi:1-acyl-sn-glycerol-3-phosphate acyltransferase
MPILLIGNHISWWDGFIPYELNRQLFKRNFHIMMLEEELRKVRFFRHLGAFSINPGTRSAFDSLDYASNILRGKDNILVVYPQGEIQSQYNEEIRFRKGWFRIIKNAVNPVKIIFMANLTDYMSHRKPALNIYLAEYDKTGKFAFDDLCDRYISFYKQSVEIQKSLK